MTTRGQINSNFYQIVDVDGNGNPTGVRANLVEAAGNLNTVQFNDGNYIAGDANFAFYPANATLVIENIEANSVNANIAIGNISNANYANFANVANIANSVDVANVNGIGNIATINLNGNIDEYLNGQGTFSGIANANFANFSNVSNISNISYSVDVGNVNGIGNIATINLNGNLNEVLSGNGTFVPFPSITTSNYSNFAGNVVNASQPNITTVGNLVNLTVVGNVVANTFTGDGSNLSNITGANVTGTVPLANLTTYVDVGNSTPNTTYNIPLVVNTGNRQLTIPSLQLQYLTYGNGTLVAANFQGDGSLLTNVIATTGNANYSNFAGTVTGATQSNITSVGTLSNLNVTGNVTANTFVGNIAVANVVGLGNIATINLTGNSGQVLLGNGGWGVASGGNANYANFAGDVVNANQPNITSVGNLSVLNVDGIAQFIDLVQFSNLVTVAGYDLQVISPGVFKGDAGGLTNIPAGNIVGNIPNANFASFAGNVVNANQPNITSVGNLVSLTITGNLSSGNANLGNLAVANFFSGNANLLSNIPAANIVGGVPVRFEVKNTSGGTLTRGTPIYVTGTVGATIVAEVAASRADTSSTMGTVGVLETTLNVNDTGFALSVGTLSSVNTSAFNVGDELYVGATGGYTNVRPTGANIVQPIGVVGRVNSSTGSIEVNIWNILDLPNLNDGNIWVGTTGNGSPVQANLSLANVGNANFASFANTVTGASQSNITSVGTLSSLNVTGNISSGANVTAAFFIGNGSQLTGISGGGGASISNGTSNVNIATANGNVTFGINGISNVLTVSDNTLTVIANGNITLSGTGSQISGANLISATNGNIGNIQLKIYEETLPAVANTSTSISPDVSTGSIFRYTANANFTMNTLTNAVAGTSATIIITQDATGNRILTSNMKYAGGGKILSTTANTTDIISVFYDGTTYYATLSKGYS